MKQRGQKCGSDGGFERVPELLFPQRQLESQFDLAPPVIRDCVARASD